MRVLDIDLDFYLADCCPLALPGERPALEGHEPWLPERVDAFLRENCGLDPKEWTALAFGVGVDRVASLKYGISDIRLEYENDARFLRQF